MTVEEALVAHLEEDVAVAALVGERIYPLRAPQDAPRPYLVYQRISTPRVRSQSGPSGLAHPRFQIAVVTATYAELRSLAAAVVTALDGFRGLLGGEVQTSAFVANEADGYADATGAYEALVDVILWHRE